MKAGLRQVIFSNFSPLSVVGLKLGFAADRISGLADGNPVGTWSDFSGNGNDGGAAGSAKPLFKTNILNGKPIVRFDGVDDAIITAAFGSALSQPITMYLVFKLYTPASSGLAITDGITSGHRGMALGNFPANTWDVYAGGSDTNAGTSNSNWNIATVVTNGASSTFRLNNGTEVSISPGTNDLTGFKLAEAQSGGGHAQIDVAEVELYAGAHSSSQQTLMRNYLNSKWAIF